MKRDIAMAEAGIPRGAGMAWATAAAVVAVIWVWATGKSNVFSLGCQRQKSEFATNSNWNLRALPAMPR